MLENKNILNATSCIFREKAAGSNVTSRRLRKTFYTGLKWLKKIDDY